MSRSRMPKWHSSSEAASYFSSHQRVKGFDMQVAKAHALSWNCDGTRIACGAQDRRISIAVVDSSCRLRVERVADNHDDSVDNVAFQHNAPYIFASASVDKTICIWDVRQPKKHTKIGTKSPNLNVDWSPCGRYLVYGDKNDKVWVIDGRTLSTLNTHDFKVETNEFAFHPNGQFLFVATANGKVEIFRMPELEHVDTIQAHSQQSTCLSLALNPDGSRMAVGGNDALCSIWNTDDLICESTISRLEYPVRSCSFSSEGNLLAIGSEDHYIDIGWADDASKVSDVHVDGEVYGVAWHPRQPILAFVSSNSDSRDRDNIRLFGFTR